MLNKHLENIRQRLDSIEFDYEKMNPYMLFFDCKYLLAEVDYYIRRTKEAELKLEAQGDYEFIKRGR